MELLQAPVTSQLDVLNRFGLEAGKYILTVGRFVPEKGFHDLIAAFSRVQGLRNETQDKNPPQSGYCPIENSWKLVIVGDADHEDKYSRELKRQAAETPHTVTTGFLTGKPLQEIYTQAGLFVLPSYYEGLPIVLLEAMSYGLSCLASDIEAHKEVGLKWPRLFKAGDIHELSGRIKYFMNRGMNDTEKNYQIRRIREQYDWEKIATATVSVYTKVLVQRKVTDRTSILCGQGKEIRLSHG